MQTLATCEHMSKKKGEGPESVAAKSERTNLPLEESTRKSGYKYSGLVQTVCKANICTLLVHKLSVKREKAEHEGKRKYTC